jgi:hypothetical protein
LLRSQLLFGFGYLEWQISSQPPTSSHVSHSDGKAVKKQAENRKNWEWGHSVLGQPDRRQLIRGTGVIAGAAALSGIIPATSRADNETLNLLCWPSHADAAAVKPFEDKHHVKVVAKEYVGGEAMLALMNQSPPGSYDVVLSDAEYVIMLRDGGFIEQLNPADYPFADFWPDSKHLMATGWITNSIR